jgi:hypothetical protein
MPYPYLGAGTKTMAFAWRKTDSFCSVWSAAKPRSNERVTAVGEYPSDRRRAWKTNGPVLANLLKAKARSNESALPIHSTPLAPPALPKAPVELLPSTEVRFPRSLTQWRLVQIEGKAWPKPDASAIWNVVVQRTARTSFPEHELRGLKPRVWRRNLDAPKLTGLQSADSRTLPLDFQRPAGPGNLSELMSPSWREMQIRESADATRVQAASLSKTHAVKRWSAYDTARSSVTPLHLLAPNFVVSVPEPKPLK